MPSVAQPLDILIDATAGTGILRSAPNGDSTSRRAPTFLDVDIGLVLDGDFGSEWGVGTRFDLEDQASVSLAPQVRLVKPTKVVDMYIGGGIPLVVSPKVMLGAAIDLGARYPLSDVFGLSIGGQIAVVFAGDGLASDSAVTLFSLAVGGQARF